MQRPEGTHGGMDMIFIFFLDGSYMAVCASGVLNQGWFCHPRNIWQCLETLLIVMTRATLLASGG